MAGTASLRFCRVYVWQLPVRLFHWVNAACILILAVTGFLIGSPLTLGTSNEAFQQYWFGTIRFLHFATGFVFFFNFVFRIYWGFAGNQYARWKAYLPVKREQLQEIVEVLKVDILQTQPSERISIGHNTLAGVTYFLFFLVCLFEMFTGFALYSGMSQSVLPRLFWWVTPLMGGEMAVRQWHHIFMWWFVVFALIHVYLVFYHDYVEGRGTASSMAGGWKFTRADDGEE